MYNSPPFWEHGVFLQPQHFQLSHVQQLRRLAQGMALMNPWLWGVRRVAVNEDALANDIFEVVSLELLLPSGAWVVVPDNAALAPRAFRDAWTNPESPLTISLGLAPLREQGGNVARVDDPAQDQCSGMLNTGCFPRFGKNNPIPFGGFPGTSLLRK